MNRILNGLIDVPSNDPDDARRRKILNTILLFIFGFVPIGFAAILAYSILSPDYDHDEMVQLIVVFSVMLVLSVGIYFVNRYYSGFVASIMLEVFFLLSCSFSDMPQEVADGRSTAVFVIPIIISSMILPSFSSIVLAIISCVIITIIGQTVSVLPNFFTMIMFLMTAVLCWYSSHILQQSLGELRTINRELDSSRVEQIIPTLSSSGDLLSAAAARMVEMANDLKESAEAQTNAVRETRVAIQVIAEASQTITRTARAVRTNADLTLKHSENVSKQIEMLSLQIRKISEILELIKDIANRSDILSLNAALEGVRAGDAGHGFSLVASQIQKLSESVMSSVGDVNKLITSIFEASDTTLTSMEETNQLARTTVKAGQEIVTVSENQQSSTLQVSAALDHMTSITDHLSAGSIQTFSSARDLNETARQLRALIDELTGNRRATQA